MPSPVSFLLSISTFPAGYNATPAQFATDLVNRMTVTPSAPWNSFQIQGTIPSASGASNVGPVLYDNGAGGRWYTFNTGTGGYAPLVVDGSGILNHTVPLSALATGTPGALLSYDGSGNPTSIAPAVSGTGYVLTQQGSGLFAPMAPTAAPGGSYFEAYPSASSQAIAFSGGGSTTVLAYNTARYDTTSSFNTAGNYFPIPANQVWYLYASCQLDWSSATGGNTLQLVMQFSNAIGTLYNYTAPLGRAGASTGAVIQPSGSPQNITVQIVATGTGTGTVAMLSNASNNRFGGFRIS